MAWQCKGGFSATWMPKGCWGGEWYLGCFHRTGRGRWQMMVCCGGQFFQELQPTHLVVISEEVEVWGWSKLPAAPKLLLWVSCMSPHCVLPADRPARLCHCPLPLVGVQWWDWLTPALSSSMYLKLMFLKTPSGLFQKLLRSVSSEDTAWASQLSWSLVWNLTQIFLLKTKLIFFFPPDITEMNAGGRKVWLVEHRVLLN